MFLLSFYSFITKLNSRERHMSLLEKKEVLFLKG